MQLASRDNCIFGLMEILLINRVAKSDSGDKHGDKHSK